MGPVVKSNYIHEGQPSAILFKKGVGNSRDHNLYQESSPSVMAYFSLVKAGNAEVMAGRRFCEAESIAAKIEGFPTPDPAPGQVWWARKFPVLFGQIDSGPPRVYCRIGENNFLCFDKRTDDGSFVYAPTPQEYDLWKHPIQSFDPII